MRVLHVSSGNLYGGVETLLVTLAKYRRLCPDLEQEFALCFAGRVQDELRATGAQVHHLGGVRLSRPASVWRARRALEQVLASGRYDIVICHSSWPQVIFGPVARRVSLPLVYWLHGSLEELNWLDRLAKRVRPDLAICNSRFTAQHISKLYRGVEREVLYCPVAAPEVKLTADERRAVRAELRTPDDAVVIVQVSRLEAWKGHLLHIAALSQLREVPNWVCWMIGGAQRPAEFEYLNHLKEAASQNGIAERIKFLGQRPDVPRLLAAADIHCQPNTGPEPFGITFVEALYAGLPVVTTAMGGACEIVDEGCGRLVGPDDATALGNALRGLITSPTERASLAQGGDVRAHNLCDPARQVQGLSRILSCRGAGQPRSSWAISIAE
jgi:glycosyltransferase involved in cell wall biosynthesis